MPYTFQHIVTITGEEFIVHDPDAIIELLLIDSRRLVFPAVTLFFALQAGRKSGEAFVEELYAAGVRCFVVTTGFDHTACPGANFLKVVDPLRTLQHIAAYHRQQFTLPVIGITGSNGKTIVKEWLYQLLSADYNIVRSPRSYNSQIGVPLSVWQISDAHTLGIFEAGISQSGEMDFLERVIQPTLGSLNQCGCAAQCRLCYKT